MFWIKISLTKVEFRETKDHQCNDKAVTLLLIHTNPSLHCCSCDKSSSDSEAELGRAHNQIVYRES